VPDTPEVAGIDARFRRSRMHTVLGDLLERAIAVRAVVRIEDVQWLDDASREVFEAVLRRIDRLPWIVCTTRHPGSTPVGPARLAERHTLELSPLSADETALLAERAAGAAGFPEGWADTIAARAEGHPVFTIELAAAARTQGIDALPDSVEAAITARLDALSAADRVLVREASVVGFASTLPLLGAALGAPTADPARWRGLEALVRVDPDGTVLFRHTLLHRVAYDGLSFRRRRELHRAAGEAIETGAFAADERANLLSLHFHRAEDWERAWTYSVDAARRAHDLTAVVEAIEYYRRALDSARGVPTLDPAAHAGAAEALGDLLELAARYNEAGKAYATSRRLIGGRTALQARLVRKEGVLRERAGRYSQALTWYSRGLRPLATVGPDDGADAVAERARLTLAYAGVRYRQGRYRDTARLAERAVEDAEHADDLHSLGHATYLRSIAETSLGRRDAVLYGQRALALYEELGDHLGQANVLNNLGIAAYYDGRWTDALELYGRSRAARQRAGDSLGGAVAANNIGEVLSDQGRLDEAVALFATAQRAFEDADYPIGVGLALSNRGRAATRGGRPDDGLELLDTAVARLRGIRALPLAFEAETRRVECLLVLGRVADAEGAAADLLGRLRTHHGDEVLVVALLRAQGWLALSRGDRAAALTLGRDALGRAEALDARFEEALTLQLLAELDDTGAGDGSAESDGSPPPAERSRRIFASLGVHPAPAVPAVARQS